ncbi:hypothetical protein [Chitinophaga nivalis]|uniref:Uncharacterized protein n=1 Tax=Chitinophaga nivalis TaxID=2991709 RepID=A0ABT3IT28_9BACT|nr:hypothetical protein [Chitinophaga nivalis]MCW3463178.1 hypothetical protein [Chitinophaga nivalis]MCW3487132.1 hypothetical protein [Chitinophaga nivalis]
MYSKFLHKVVAIILLGVFSINTIPREFIHHFAGHSDTEDERVITHGITISEQHRHCDFLQIGVEPYTQFSADYFAPVRKISWIFYPPAILAATLAVYHDLSPRAPPVVYA